MKDQWKGLALILFGLITGGGASAAVASYKIAVVRAELQADIEEVKEDGDETQHNVNALAVGMARIEEQLKAANEKLDALAR